jgi:hypothetical protein
MKHNKDMLSHSRETVLDLKKTNNKHYVVQEIIQLRRHEKWICGWEFKTILMQYKHHASQNPYRI